MNPIQYHYISQYHIADFTVLCNNSLCLRCNEREYKEKNYPLVKFHIRTRGPEEKLLRKKAMKVCLHCRQPIHITYFADNCPDCKYILDFERIKIE